MIQDCSPGEPEGPRVAPVPQLRVCKRETFQGSIFAQPCHWPALTDPSTNAHAKRVSWEQLLHDLQGQSHSTVMLRSGAVHLLWFLACKRLTLNRDLAAPRRRPTYIFLSSMPLNGNPGLTLYRRQMGLSHCVTGSPCSRGAPPTELGLWFTHNPVHVCLLLPRSHS